MQIAIDRDTGKLLDEEDSELASDNPRIYTWVVWIEVQVEKNAFPNSTICASVGV